jgi:cyclopropane fatty-acyl-phospholipid synthase-like methyltransferase
MLRTRRSVAYLLLALAVLMSASAAANAGEIDRIVEILHLEAGESVADVGAGDGDFAVGLAAAVGREGRLYATEVKENLVTSMRERFAEAGLDQSTAILGSQDDLGLEAGCCDAILLRLVYHHFEDPDTMRAALWRALRPGGRIAVIDITPQENWAKLPGVPDRGGHGIPTAALEAEMLGAGFERVERHSDWNGDEDRFAVVFQRPASEQ